MKVAFAGTPDFATTILHALASSPHEVGLVISQPDPRKGRGRKTTLTPVAELAGSYGLPLAQPARISEVSAELDALDALVVAAYGQILRPDTLYATNHGGRVDVTSTLGDGSTFTLRLPARPPEAPLPLPTAIEIESGAAGR